MELVAKNGDASLGADVENGYKQISAQVPVEDNGTRVPQDIKWNGVNFSVNGANGKKNILTNCWGEVKAGEVCAIMGPSGAGKSSLLNVLAGRSAAGEGISITGNVSVAGSPINPVLFRNKIAYVMQDDALMATQTPEDALRFSASLRLPADVPEEKINSLVQHTLEQLGIDVCKDVMIGGPMIKGISGGQRKRTSIGIEIITNPALLFLDEPTSGLDSYTAFSIVQILKKMSLQNTAVLVTIHQPSSEIFFLFDIVVFMKDGHIFYQGSATGVSDHFAALGCPCPSNYNPADFVMTLSQSETMAELEKKNLMMPTPDFEGKVRNSSIDLTAVVAEDNNIKTANFCTQLQWLLQREYLNLTRNKAALGARFGVTIFLNLLFGLIFLGAGGKDNADPDSFSTHFGAMTMITISSMFGSAQPTMLEFPFERPMFMREYVTGTYSAAAYFISKSVVELPLTFIQTVVQYLIVYFFVDLQGPFILLVLAAWGLGIAAASLAVCLGCAVPDVKNVTELAPLLFVPQILFAGFFVKMSQIPVFLRWVQYLCSLKYSMNLLLILEFDKTNPSCETSAQAAANCANALDSNNVEPDQWLLYAAMLAVLFIGFRTFGAFVLVGKSKKFY